MIHFYTNRQMAAILDINLSRWKRWSREFLPPDPLGGLQSGLARQYTIAEAFTVYLCGYLVASLDFSIPEARKIAQDLHSCREIPGLLDGFDPNPATAGAPPEGVEATRIRIWRLPATGAEPIRFGYLLRLHLRSAGSKSESARVAVEYVREIPFGETGKASFTEEPMSWRTLNIGRLQRWFMERLGTHDG